MLILVVLRHHVYSDDILPDTTLTFSCERPLSTELSEFEKVINDGLSLRDMYSELNNSNLTVAHVFHKWKVSRNCRNMPRISKPTKRGVETDRRCPE
ncbi:hypothetical protein TNCV_2477371 [Trichonephila clavipes]|nr:hypothetical protein TNCV_2477371 [Trichonephila clavipes]